MGSAHFTGSREPGKVFWVRVFLFSTMFSRFLFRSVLFNLCAVFMNELLSIYKEPGSGGAIALSNHGQLLPFRVSCCPTR